MKTQRPVLSTSIYLGTMRVRAMGLKLVSENKYKLMCMKEEERDSHYSALTEMEIIDSN